MATPSSIIYLSTGATCIVDTDLYPVLMQHDWQERPDGSTSYAWRQTKINKKYVGIAMHRFIMNCPENRVIDHIDGNGLNNVRSNLRIVTRAHNDLNRKKRKGSASNFYGVSFHKQSSKWRASGTSALSGAKYTIGEYGTELEAAEAYNIFCAKYNPFSRLNVI